MATLLVSWAIDVSTNVLSKLYYNDTLNTDRCHDANFAVIGAILKTLWLCAYDILCVLMVFSFDTNANPSGAETE